MKWCTCIIPFYNEEARIVSVIETLSSISLIDQIIVVDDGSIDNGKLLVQEYCNQCSNKSIKLISYEQNRGKSYAVSIGLKEVETSYVLTFDADLSHIQPAEILFMIESMYADPHIDMGILRRITSNWYIKLLYRELILSGQRMLKTQDLREVFAHNLINKYQLEVAINMYMEAHHKTTLRYPFSAENVFKYQKRWFWYGLHRDILMFKDIFSYMGLVWFCRHIFLFKPQYIIHYQQQHLITQSSQNF